MLKRISGFLALLGLLLLTGCLEFEQQTLTYRYDGEADTLRIFHAYQGIFGGDQKRGISAKEEEELESVRTGQRTFFFSNWIWEYDREQVCRELDSLGKPEARPDAKLDPAVRARQAAFLRLLLENVKVENGVFYLDGRGRLCGTQSVTVTRFSALVAAANGSLRDLLRSEAERENVSPGERSIYLKSAAQDRPYIAVDGNQLRFRLPFTDAAYEKAFSPDSRSTRQLGLFQRQGGTFAFADNEMAWSLGTPTAPFVALTLPVSEQPYSPNLMDALKGRVRIRRKLDSAAAAKKFVRGHGQGKQAPK